VVGGRSRNGTTRSGQSQPDRDDVARPVPQRRLQQATEERAHSGGREDGEHVFEHRGAARDTDRCVDGAVDRFDLQRLREGQHHERCPQAAFGATPQNQSRARDNHQPDDTGGEHVQCVVHAGYAVALPSVRDNLSRISAPPDSLDSSGPESSQRRRMRDWISEAIISASCSCGSV
jgi:hypothetical protein